MSSLASIDIARDAAGDAQAGGGRGFDRQVRAAGAAGAGDAIVSVSLRSVSLRRGSPGSRSARRGPGLRAWLGYPRAVLRVALARGGRGFD